MNFFFESFFSFIMRIFRRVVLERNDDAIRILHVLYNSIAADKLPNQRDAVISATYVAMANSSRPRAKCC